MLCDSLSDFNNSPILAEADDEQPLHLLYVVKGDLPVIVGFYKNAVPPDRNEEAMLLSFSDMFWSFAGSSASQAFIVRQGGNPLLEVEMHRAALHFPYDQAYPPADDDYYMILNAGAFDGAEPAVYEKALRLCWQYFWSFPEVGAIVTLAADGPCQAQQDQLFRQTGMIPLTNITLPDQASLYRISRP